MIEKYRTHVIKQQQKKILNGGSCSKQVRSCVPSRNYKIGGVTTTSVMSHSQPCLFSVDEQRIDLRNNALHLQYSFDSKEENVENVLLSNADCFKNFVKSSEVDRLHKEVNFLRQQVENLQDRSDKLKQLELAYAKIEQEFEQVVLQCENHEKLEKSVIFKMEQQIQRLTQENSYLQKETDKLQAKKKDIGKNNNEKLLLDEQQQKIRELNMILSDLIPKNKELMAIEERQRIELDAQTTTLEEQRTHIDMLEKALSNAQERLQAKDRQALDAVAVMDKCAHLQKLLQESFDEKQKCQNDYNKQKAQLEMEIAQLRMQISKDNTSFGPKKSPKSLENEEITKLRKLSSSKDERISQLETSLLKIQKRYSDELQRKVSEKSTESLTMTVKSLESKNTEKDRRIQNLLDEKQRIHNQWAEERRSLDYRVRLLEQDLRILMMGSNKAISSFLPSYNSMRLCNSSNNNFSSNAFNLNASLRHNCSAQSGFNSSKSSSSGGCAVEACFGSDLTRSNVFSSFHNSFNNNNDVLMLHHHSSSDLSTNSRSATFQDSTYIRMEELRRKIADRRASIATGISNSSLTGKSLYGINSLTNAAVSSKFLNEADNIENIVKTSSKDGSNLSLNSFKPISRRQVLMEDIVMPQQQRLFQHKINDQFNQNKSYKFSCRMSAYLPDMFSKHGEILSIFDKRRFLASEHECPSKPQLQKQVSIHENFKEKNNSSKCNNNTSMDITNNKLKDTTTVLTSAVIENENPNNYLRKSSLINFVSSS